MDLFARTNYMVWDHSSTHSIVSSTYGISSEIRLIEWPQNKLYLDVTDDPLLAGWVSVWAIIELFRPICTTPLLLRARSLWDARILLPWHWQWWSTTGWLILVLLLWHCGWRYVGVDLHFNRLLAGDRQWPDNFTWMDGRQQLARVHLKSGRYSSHCVDYRNTMYL